VTSPLTRLACIAAIAFAGCDRTEQTISGPLKQRGYLWQREWTPAVVEALDEADRRMDGVVILGAEINLAGKKPEIVKATIDWDAVKRGSQHRALAFRATPFAGPFRSDDAPAQAIIDLAKQLLSDARANDVNLEEFQFDFDCAQKNLGGSFLRSASVVHRVVLLQPENVVLTATRLCHPLID